MKKKETSDERTETTDDEKKETTEERKKNTNGRNDTRTMMRELQAKGLLTSFTLLDDDPEYRKQFPDKSWQEGITMKTPKQLVSILNKDVIGQDEAKKVLSVAIYNHYKRVLKEDDFNKENKDFRNVNIEKSNIIMLGETGSGKTYMLKCIANAIGVPIHIASATSLTASGYVGDDVESVLSGLLQAANFDINKAEHGIVVIDEIDKIRKSGVGRSLTKDVSGECVQQGLLKMVEGSVIGIQPNGGRKHPEQKLTYLDTKDILFIGLGAFVGLEDIISKRTKVENKIGFSMANDDHYGLEDEDILSNVEQTDLIEFGMIPEFVGRFPVIVSTKKLTLANLERILVEPRSSLVKQYTKLMKMDGIDLSFGNDAIEEIATIAMNRGLGARGLRSVMEKILNNVMFEGGAFDDNSIIIDREYVRDCFPEKISC